MVLFLKNILISSFIFDLKTQTFIFDDFKVSDYLGVEKKFFYQIVDNYADDNSKNMFWTNIKNINSQNSKCIVKIDKQNKKKVFFLIEEIFFENQNLKIVHIYNFSDFLKIKSLIKVFNRIISIGEIISCFYNSKNETIRLLSRNLIFVDSNKNTLKVDEFLSFFDKDFQPIVENIVKKQDKRYIKNTLKCIDKNKNIHYFKIVSFKLFKNGVLYFTMIDLTSYVSKENILLGNIKDLTKQKNEDKEKIKEQNEKIEKNYETLQNLKNFLTSNLKEISKKATIKELEDAINLLILELENKIEKVQTDSLPKFTDSLKIQADFSSDKRKLFDKQGKIAVLIAEDEEINFAYLELLVRKVISNVEILHAKNGVEAVQIAQQNPIDLVLMDLRMPLLDGISAAKKIKHFKNKIPIIVVSALEQNENEDYTSIDEYINKPIDRSKIEKVINKYIKK